MNADTDPQRVPLLSGMVDEFTSLTRHPLRFTEADAAVEAVADVPSRIAPSWVMDSNMQNLLPQSCGGKRPAAPVQRGRGKYGALRVSNRCLPDTYGSLY
jgi:hypothetical protein